MTGLPNIADPEALLEAVRTVWHNLLPLQEANDDQSWVEAGGDSLDLLKLLAHLEIVLDHPLPPELIDMEMTPRTLAMRIRTFLTQA